MKKQQENQNVPQNILEFAYLPDYTNQINTLAQLAIAENWTRENKQNSVLANYIAHTFKRLAYLYNHEDDCTKKNQWIYFCPKPLTACFNTGLYTKNYNKIYALFVQNTSQKPDKQPLKLKGFFDESSFELVHIPILPKRATYFSDIKDLIFDTNCDLRINLDHILNDEENFMRIPEQYRNGSNIKTLFNGAIEIAKKRIASNYNIAVPQFFEGYVQLLIPISLGEDISHTDLVLAVSRNNGVYLGKTCLTLDMAYNNARLIAKPEAPWINKQE